MAQSEYVNMVSLRTFTLRTTKGFSHNFKAGEPTPVHKSVVDLAMAQGCVPEDQANIPFKDADSKQDVGYSADVRKSMLYLACKRLNESNRTQDFDAGGYPKPGAVEELLAFMPNRDELVKTFQQYKQDDAEGVEPALHENAAKALAVLDADGRDELIALAVEHKLFEEADFKGLQVKTIRAKILTALSGM